MPTYAGKDGKKKFHMNPQMGKSMHSGGKELSGEHHSSASTSHDESKVGHGEHEVPDHVKNYDGHLHNNEPLAHHVELHHGGHPEGEPPMHEGHTHHTVAHHAGGGEGEHHITNHESYSEASEHASNSMHDGCEECGHGEGDDVTSHESEEDAEVGTDSDGDSDYA